MNTVARHYLVKQLSVIDGRAVARVDLCRGGHRYVVRATVENPEATLSALHDPIDDWVNDDELGFDFVDAMAISRTIGRYLRELIP